MNKLIAKIKSFVRANEHEMDYLMTLCEKDSDAVSLDQHALVFVEPTQAQRILFLK